MPTLIDSLVVELGLDPSKFDAGQQKALNSLRKFEGEAGQTQKRIADSSAENLKFAFDALKNPFEAGKKLLFDYATGAEDAGKRMTNATQGSQRGLKDLGVQASRTGQGVAKGAEEGALGMRGLAAGALMAVAAFTTLKGLLDYTAKATSDAAQAGYRAGWIGLPVEQATAFSAAAYQKTGAPQEQTQSWMQQLQSSVQAFLTPGSPTQGQPNELLQTLWRNGIQPIQVGEDPGKALQDTMKQLETRFQGMTDPQRATLAGQLGMNPLLAEFMALGPAAVDAATKAASLVATTKDEADAAQALEQAERKVETATDSLARTLMTQLAPGLITVFDTITGFLGKVSTAVKQPDDTTSGWPKWLQALEKTSGLYWLLRLTGQLSDKDKDAGTGATSSGATSFGSAPMNAKPNFTSTGDASTTPREQMMLDQIEQKESHNRNVPNYRYDADHTASGFWQITDTNWQAYGPKVGIDTKQYPSAMSAPYALQQMVALYMLRQQGSAPWDTAHGGSIPPGSYAPTSAPPAPPALSAQPPASAPAKTSMNLSGMASNLGMIRTAMATPNVVHNSGGNTMTNHINVQVPPGSPDYVTGAHVAQEVRRQIIVSTANSGYA